MIQKDSKSPDDLTGDEPMTEQESAEVNGDVLDRLKKRLGLKNDYELAEKLGVHKSFVAMVRTGRRQLPISSKLRLLDKLGYLAARDTILSLTPKGFAAKVRESDNARLQLDLSHLDDAHTDEDQSEEFREFEKTVAAAIQKFGATAVASLVKTKIMTASPKASKK